MRLRSLVLLAAFAALAAGLLAAFLGGLPQRAWDAARLVASVSGQAPTPAGWVVRDQELWTERAPDGALRDRQGTLYTPVHRAPAAALVLVPGADMAGQAHPLFVAFAESLSAAGFAVLVPDIATLRRLELSAADAQPVAGAVAHMAGQELGRDGVVVAAISYAVGPALLAALRPEAAGRVAAVLGIGGYYDSRAAATFFTTGGYRDPDTGAWARREPSNVGRFAFLNANAGLLEDMDDRVLLQEMARARARDPDAPIDHLERLLTPEGAAVWAMLTNRDPARADSLIDALPRDILAEIAALNLAGRDLSGLDAELILIHGRDDPVIPHTESRALAAAAPEASLYLLDSLQHVELTLDTLSDGLTLYAAAWHLLSVRDRLD